MSIAAAKMTASRLLTMNHTKISLQNLIRSHIHPFVHSSAPKFLFKEKPINWITSTEPTRLFCMGLGSEENHPTTDDNSESESEMEELEYNSMYESPLSDMEEEDESDD